MWWMILGVTYALIMVGFVWSYHNKRRATPPIDKDKLVPWTWPDDDD